MPFSNLVPFTTVQPCNLLAVAGACQQTFGLTVVSVVNVGLVAECKPTVLHTVSPSVAHVNLFRVTAKQPLLACRVAFFKCQRCSRPLEVLNLDGRVQEPEKCAGCGAKLSLDLIHNLSTFTNKQMVKMQVGSRGCT